MPAPTIPLEDAEEAGGKLGLGDSLAPGLLDAEGWRGGRGRVPLARWFSVSDLAAVICHLLNERITYRTHQ